jgi:hypothetical protein
MLAGESVKNFLHALVAVLAGNAAYFLLMPHLPQSLRHVTFRTDVGLAVDAAFCLVALGFTKFVAGRKRGSANPR